MAGRRSPAPEPIAFACAAAGGADAEIAVRGVRKIFRRRGGDAFSVFDGLDVTIRKNEFVAVVGPSGCGKTTLLNMIAGLTMPTEGEITVGGRPVRGPGRDRGVVFQQDAIFMWRTVRRNVSYGLEIRGLPRREREQRVDEHLRLVGLENFGDFYPKELSGGMKKRVAIATVLANQPEVLLMDEPFGALDYPSRIALQDEVIRIWETDRITTVFVTHDIEEALYLADRVLVLVAGKLVEDVTVPFPRPRRPELRTSAEMITMKDHLWRYMVAAPDEQGAGR